MNRFAIKTGFCCFNLNLIKCINKTGKYFLIRVQFYYLYGTIKSLTDNRFPLVNLSF